MRTFILTCATLIVAITMGAIHGVQDFFIVITPLALYWLYGAEPTNLKGPFENDD